MNHWVEGHASYNRGFSQGMIAGAVGLVLLEMVGLLIYWIVRS